MQTFKYVRILSVTLLLTGATAAWANMNIFACEPEWESLAKELGGDKVSTYSATNGMQDPHHIQARPSLIARARSADLLICTGADLEVGWLPQILQQSSNSKIQPGKDAYIEAAMLVERIEVPTRLDRAEGDVHAAGNPHIQLDPRNIKLVAAQVYKRLAELDNVNAAYYQQRYKDFNLRWDAALAGWEKQTEKLRGMPVVEHHKLFGYLFRWLGMKDVGQLEPKPGIEPTTAHLAELLQQLQQHPAKLVLRATYQDDRASRWLSDHAHIPALAIPATVGGSDKAKDLFSFYDDIVQRLQGIGQ
ncbi:MAG: zinc ABC transporter substrate-binding protein [Gammaproteobacteria bacterium]|nr:zinc ABC transporter substrate-binding protein [Gammaproteobacteria bacterium]